MKDAYMMVVSVVKPKYKYIYISNFSIYNLDHSDLGSSLTQAFLYEKGITLSAVISPH